MPKRIALLCVAFVVVALACYRVSEYKGDGKIRDTGILSYPRYHIELPPFDFATTGAHVYRIVGAPDVPLNLQFYLAGRTIRDAETFENSTTRMMARIVAADGREICSVEGTPAASADSERWVLMSSAIESAYWHSGCLDFELSKQSYRLEVAVLSVDPQTPRVALHPRLEGGGNELP
jgi:hypothetical protein